MVSAALPDARAQGGAPKRGFPVAPTAAHNALTGGVVSLRTPGPEVILLPRSTFTMGSSRVEVQLALDACRREPLGEECKLEMFENELDPHRVTVSPFWLDRTEVTVDAYRRCADAGVCAPVAYEQGARRFEDAALPVSLVSWHDANTYCAFVGKRLPTEAEWERAARGRIGRRFPWGDHYATRRANHGAWALDNTDASDGHEELAPVGSYPDGRTPDGFDDLAGNVAEWTADAYEDGYEALPVTDPKGPSFGSYKVVRGGAYTFGMPWLRATSRMFRTASTRAPYLGFRCARSATVSALPQ
jgi:formylglycine-generating enzyme required for sulfatase activity